MTACRRHSVDGCASCRGRRNKYRGDDIEREACAILGVSRVGHHLGKTDGGTEREWIAVQVKSGGSYPERIDRWLRALDTYGLRAVVSADAPGPGRRRRWLITFDLREFMAWMDEMGWRELVNDALLVTADMGTD